MKRSLLTLLISIPTLVHCQNDLTARNVFENYSLVNPAFTGVRGNKLSTIMSKENCPDCFYGNFLGETKLKSGNHYLGAAVGIDRYHRTWTNTYKSLNIKLNYAKSYTLDNGNQFRAALGLKLGEEQYRFPSNDDQSPLISRRLAQASLGAAYITKNWEYGMAISTINLPFTDFINRNPYYDMEFYATRKRVVNSNLTLNSSLAIGLRFDQHMRWQGFSNLQYNLEMELKHKFYLGMYVGGKSTLGGISAGYKFSEKFEVRANWDVLDFLEYTGNSSVPISTNAIFRF